MRDDVSMMTMTQLIGASSLNAPESTRFRRRTPAAVKQQLLAKLVVGTLHDGIANDHSPYFFLGHAAFSGLEEQADVRELFDLLSGHLLPLTRDLDPGDDPDRPATPVGLLADHVRASALEPALTRDALLSCRVFVPLLSPVYLASERCLSELEAFRQRDNVRRAHHPFGFSAIMPVLWTGADELGPLDRLGLNVDAAWGDEYYDVGLRGLMRHDRRSFHRVVFRILERIRDLAVLPISPD